MEQTAGIKTFLPFKVNSLKKQYLYKKLLALQQIQEIPGQKIQIPKPVEKVKIEKPKYRRSNSFIIKSA